MSLLKEAFERFAPDYLERYGQSMLPSHRRCLTDISSCQTDALDGSLHVCQSCGHEHYTFHSCGNRSCIKCHHLRTDKWLDKQQDNILPTRHFHYIVTLPSELRPIMCSNQKKSYKILMTSAFAALQKLASAPKHLGGKIGAIAVLQTWRRAMIDHPHVHMRIPAGAYNKDDDTWIRGREKFLVPIDALKSIFRAIFMKRMRKALPKQIFPQAIWKKKWSIHINTFDSKVENLLNYLGRYVYRIAITENRVLAVSQTTVTINHNGEALHLRGEEFIRRYLQHVLPKGFHKVRYFGIMHSAHKQTRNRIKLLLMNEVIIPDRPVKKKSTRCLKCSSTLILSISVLAPRNFNCQASVHPP